MLGVVILNVVVLSAVVPLRESVCERERGRERKRERERGDKWKVRQQE
jgi:hypothetical protein